MAERVDLDAAERDIATWAREVDNVYTDVRYRAPMAQTERLALALVAELRVAREHYQDLRANREWHSNADCTPSSPCGEGGRYACDACLALAAYDQAGAP